MIAPESNRLFRIITTPFFSIALIGKLFLKALKKTYKKFVIFLVGFFVLILGVTLILIWRQDVIILIRGVIGIVLALAGLFTLYALNKM